MDENKKYELTNESITCGNVKMFRIKSLKDFGTIKCGDLGGWIADERNLSQTGDAWVFDNAKVCNNALVCDNARVSGDAWVFDNAKVYDNAWVSGNVNMGGNAMVCGNAMVWDNVRIFHNVWIFGNAEVSDNVELYDNVKVYGNAKVHGNAEVCDKTEVYGNAEVAGIAKVQGNANIYGDAKVYYDTDYIVFKNFWSSGRYFTWTRSNDKYKVGCFYGSGEELVKKAYQDSEISGKNYKLIVDYVESIKKSI